MPEPNKCVFLCADDDDMDTAKRLYGDLESEGVSVWLWSEDLLAGQHRNLTVKQEIRKSSHFLAMISETSIAKRGFVQRMLNIAIDVSSEVSSSAIYIIPIRVNDCELPQELGHIHWVDLFPSYEDALNRLLKSLKQANPGKNTNSESAACTPGHFFAHKGDPNHKGLLPLEERLSHIIPGQNPYITGTPLPGNSPVFFGREQILHEILSALRKPGKPACISLLGERRIGKSSLLNQICQAMKTEKNLITVYGNAQNQSQCTPEEFYRSIHQSVCVALSVNPKPDANTFDLFRDFIREQARNFRFVLVIDEFEDMAANKNFGDTFFTNLRHLGERHEYAFGFLLASRRPLHEICHQNDIASSSFWNIFGISHILGLLREHEAEALIREPMKRSLNGTLKNPDDLLNMTGFHPALIQMVMDKYHTAFSGKYRPDKEQIIHGLRPYYQDLWKRRTKEEKELLIRLAEGSVESGAIQQEMKLRGLVCNRKPFSPLFADFVLEMNRHEL